MGTYNFIIGVSAVIILSLLFNLIAKKTNIPSVLMLIVLGVGIQYLAPELGLNFSEDHVLMNQLKILGNVGLILIVLEAALDLELKRDKIGVIFKSFTVALVALIGSSFAIAGLIMAFFQDATLVKALIYAVPLAIMSSAIIIPSVGGLSKEKKEFMIYESTFSDILGIMFFYFLIQNADATSAGTVLVSVGKNIGITLVISIVASYALVVLFQNIKSQVKLFLIIAVLMCLYAIGKSFHLSALIIILMFGLVLNNTGLFFRGPLKKMSNREKLKPIFHDFHVLTLESAFVTRTFFFVLFGITISLGSLVDLRTAVISISIIGSLYLIRWVVLIMVVRKSIVPQLYIAPRGLITILLFYAIPDGYLDLHGDTVEAYTESFDMAIQGFESGILLFTILITSLIMMVALVINGGGKVRDVLKANIVKEDGDDTIMDEIQEYQSSIKEHEAHDTTIGSSTEENSD
ncbi:MAG: cation:proton antiporter [Flavobacteriales bacterium]|nr:cation:proton antiporter [Flavobacteriales bacterium]